MSDQGLKGTVRRPWWRWAAGSAVPLGAIAIAWAATRQTPVSTAASHDHSAGAGVQTGGTDEVAGPVRLSAADAMRIGVTFTVAAQTPLVHEIRTVGQVTYDETRVTTVSLKTDGWVEALFVNVTGQAVVAGMPLLSIYAPALLVAQEELLLAGRFERDVAEGTAEARANAAALVAAARRRLGYWDVPLEEIQRIEQNGQVERALTLRAPTSGFVVEKAVLPGARVMAGEPLFRIADLSTVWIEGEVFERDLPFVRPGQRVRAELDAMPGAVLTGRITYLYPTVDAETRTTRVRVELPNPGLTLKPGMYATLVWNGNDGAGATALTVARSAVVSTGQRNLVFLRRSDGWLEPRLVEVGRSSSDRVEILRGLVAGDTVVRSATFLVDAESNLRAALGSAGNMPGMDMSAPAKPEGSDAHTRH